MRNNEYTKQAEDFLKKTETKIEFEYLGCSENEMWKDNIFRDVYKITLSNARGKYSFKLWDSQHDTEINHLTFQAYVKNTKHMDVESLRLSEKTQMMKKLKQIKEEAKPTAYDILACVEKYDVGTLDEFCSEFGYDTDSITANRIFIACNDEYKNISRLFSEDEMELLREIQ
jgi:aspartokinase